MPSMTNERKAKLTRREMLKTSLTAGGVALVGFRDLRLPDVLSEVQKGMVSREANISD